MIFLFLEMAENNFVELVEDYRFEINKEGVVRNKETGRILKHTMSGNRLYVNLQTGNRKALIYLLAQNFIDNPKNYEYVLQIDRDPYNISLDNIVWCDKHTFDQLTKISTSQSLVKELPEGCRKVETIKEHSFDNLYFYDNKFYKDFGFIVKVFEGFIEKNRENRRRYCLKTKNNDEVKFYLRSFLDGNV